MKRRSFLFLFVISVLLLACNEGVKNPNTTLTLESYARFKEAAYQLDEGKIKTELLKLVHEDTDSMTADYRARSYYLRNKTFLWLDRQGVDRRADSVVSYIKDVEQMGFSREKFRYSQLREDLRRFHELDFDGGNTINRVAARLEYNLTKAFFRYSIGQRFGFVNPRYVLNRIDLLDDDSTKTSYRVLYDVHTDKFDKRFYRLMLDKIRHDSVASFLKEIQPTGPLYTRLKNELATVRRFSRERTRILCNMERCRWRHNDYPAMHRKYVIVNLPSFHLQAVDGDSVLDMRIGCGSNETKTPLLTSRIKRMDINPLWVLPRSIIKKDVLKHVGNADYFYSRNFFVKERKTGRVIEPAHITTEMLTSKDFLLAQKGGEGNSLGRIIFRFDNNFSVFLHDTSSKTVFRQQDRDVSHGCIRVEKPYELAVFMLEDKDKRITDKLAYSMGAQEIEPNPDLPEGEKDTLRTDMLLRSVGLKPLVPLFITYFTIYPDESGRLRQYPDIYGYDRVISHHLRNYF
ncbi:L,D-transpeptidase family protein [Prevotella sp. A2931]|uniref:L,D-transpeptidase family protein n=1 Tax=Prevotella illustrans TaxID=2800387 RepID=A0ABS3M3N6_9BACT|nr:L,D-transpeptidase family protein [Prevotella illustrans]PTL25752.1 L,D-transpeptidase [Prevotella sp. oral taxon 820]